jgi:hypothetical protein
MITFESVKFKNILSYGNTFTEIKLNSSRTNLIFGKNGFGKCLDINTPIKIQNNKTGEILEITIGEFYEQTKNRID